jgi:hypothetical protein
MKILHILKHCRQSNGNVNVAVDLACIQSKNANEVFFASGGGDYEELLSEWGVQHLRLSKLLSVYLNCKENIHLM